MSPIEACVHCYLDARRHLRSGGTTEDLRYKQLMERASALRRVHDMQDALDYTPNDLPRPSIFIDIDGEPENRAPITRTIDRITTWLWGRPQ